MGKEAVEDYQQLGEQLDEASNSLRKAKRRASKKSPEIQGDIPSETPAEPASVSHVTEEQPADSDAASDAEVIADGHVTVEPDEKESKAAALVDLVILEALIFSTRHPLTAGRIGELMDIPSSKALRHAIAELNRQYEETGRSFRIEQVAGGYQMLTLPTYGALLNKLHQREIDSKLSRSALETLSIIAYKQPVLRAEVEAIRGVASGETIRSLMEKHLVKIAGRAEEPGRPILYGTTKRFLELFGLNSLKELPKDDQARPARPRSEAPTPAAETPVETSEPVPAEAPQN